MIAAQMINDHSPRLMVIAQIQGSGDEYRMSPAAGGMVYPSDFVAGGTTLSATISTLPVES